LINLVGNAVKFTHEGMVQTELKMTENPSAKAIDFSICVSDTGIGIAENELPSIFEVFRQVEGKDTRRYGGTGLGLAIVKHLTDLLGGTIEVESSKTNGTRFILKFKVIKFAQKKLPTPTKADFQDIEFFDSKILIVEDIESNRTLLRMFVCEHSNDIREAENGNQAIQVLQNFKPDVILMDISMPELDGFETAQILRKTNEYAQTPIIAVTAYATLNDRSKFSSVFSDYLTKPVTENALKICLSNYLKYRKIQQTTEFEVGYSENITHIELFTNSLTESSEQKVQFYKIWTDAVRPLLQRLRKRFSISDINQLSQELLRLSELNKTDIFKTIAEKMEKNIHAFDIINIKEILTELNQTDQKI